MRIFFCERAPSPELTANPHLLSYNSDLTEFLSQPWANALYAENFADFANSLRATLADDAAINDVYSQLSAMLLPTDDEEVKAVLDAALGETVARELGPAGSALPRRTQEAVSLLVRAYLRDLARARIVNVYEV